jgi:hypothetical protein
MNTAATSDRRANRTDKVAAILVGFIWIFLAALYAAKAKWFNAAINLSFGILWLGRSRRNPDDSKPLSILQTPTEEYQETNSK